MIPSRVQYRIPGLSLEARLIIFVSMAALGVLAQILLPDGGFFIGTLLMAAPLVLLSAKPWTNKPKDLGEEDWQPSSDAELDRIADNFAAIKKLRYPFWYRRAFGLPFTIILLFIAAVLLPNQPRFSLAAFDAILLFWPALHFIRIHLWASDDFRLTMTALQAARSVAAPRGIVVTPYLRLDRDTEGLRIPEDARLMVEPKRKADDLIGIQLQTAINNGPNGKVPYLYAVVLTKGKGPSYQRAVAWKPGRDFRVEKGADGDFGTVVIRQRTEGGGYYTSPEACRRLMESVYAFLLAA